ncbi:MAG: metal-dependent transcriptional regulator [Pirellulales bacterium]|nr:metal-dependent transcriptional regulator [Pirellulales bacterium]
MKTPTIETYLRVLYELGEGSGNDVAPTGAVAKGLGVAQATATVAMQKLARHGYVDYAAYRGAKLTEAGRRLALQTVRAHRILEVFLTRVLNLDWAETHAEAQRLERAVSDALLERIDSYLGSPAHCPHGDPIPRADGSLPEIPARSLAECPAGSTFTPCRILGHSPNLLRYLKGIGLAFDVGGEVVANPANAGKMIVRLNGKKQEICRRVAARILVQNY